MKKFLIYTDVHWSRTSSIIRSIGENYTTRLENVIKSVNWAENLAKELAVDEIICLGDFFDKPDLTSEEITALQEVKWANLPHSFLVGNHEAPHKELKYNSVRAVQSLGFTIIDKPTFREINRDLGFIFIPYLQDDIRKSINDYKSDFNFVDQKCVVLSHNDVKGIKYGPITTKSGIDIEDIQDNCSLFLNGHVHNGTRFCSNGFNLGNLTGKTGEEDSFKYKHEAFILTITDNNEILLDTVENPYAFHFYSLDIDSTKDLEIINKLESNAVVLFKCKRAVKSELKNAIESCTNIIQSHIMDKPEMRTVEELSTEKLTKDNYRDQFKTCAIDKLGSGKVVLEEIEKVIKN